MTTSKITDTNLLATAIERGIKQEAERLFEELKNQMVVDFERRKDTIVAGILLNVMSYVQYETIRDNLVVTTIRKDKTPDPTPKSS